MSKKRKGWVCPNCGSGINPDIMACDCVQEQEEQKPNLTLVPSTTTWTWPPYTADTMVTCPKCGRAYSPYMNHACWTGGWTFNQQTLW